MSEPLMSVAGQLIGIPAEKYSGTNGVTVDQNNKTIGLDETVLYHDSTIFAHWPGDTQPNARSITLSEDYKNFEMIRVHFARNNAFATSSVNYVDTYVMSTCGGQFAICSSFWAGTNLYLASTVYQSDNSGKILTETNGSQWDSNGVAANTCYVHVFKVVGINRIGGNA